LNYSSDLDLLGVVDAPTPSQAVLDGARLLEAVRAALTRHTSEGYAYRLDFRLRPYGSAGEMIYTLDSLEDYYRDGAAAWEVQALLKLRPVAGDQETGRRLLERLRPFLLQPRNPEALAATIGDMRRRSAEQARRGLGTGLNIKTGEGGIRDIEFLVQGLQLLHAAEHPHLLGGHTLRAVQALQREGLLAPATAAALEEDYRALRRIEHGLQLLEDQQIHALPTDPDALAALARHMAGPTATAHTFLKDLETRMRRVHTTYLDLLQGSQNST
jgi:glutamate-ammonia-ligase adenylyltransferase